MYFAFLNLNISHQKNMLTMTVSPTATTLTLGKTILTVVSITFITHFGLCIFYSLGPHLHSHTHTF